MSARRDQRPEIRERPSRAEFAAMAMTAGALLIFEITATRILSVVLWYHFAFLSISLAMVGIGAPGVWYALRPPGRRALPAALLFSGIALPASVTVIFKLGVLAVSKGAQGHETALAGGLSTPGIVLVVLAILAPCLGLGATICLLLIRTSGPGIGLIYGADLAGAAAGALIVVPAMDWIPTPLIAAGAGLLPLAALALMASQRRFRLTALAGGIVLAGLLAWQTPFALHYSKKYVERGGLLWEKWTPTARLTVFDSVFFYDNPAAAFGWGMGRRYTPTDVDQLWLEQDGSAGTVITRLDGSPRQLGHLFYDVASAGYQVFHPRRVCVIGAGGGRDILAALEGGATEVDAVELNRHIVDAVDHRFGEFSGHVYHLPGVRPIVSEGRAFLTRTDRRYDLIQIALIDSWAATAAGAFALSENYLYTVEAFDLYFSRLSEDGVISISRWMEGRRRLEAARLLFLAERALARAGVENPKAHMAVLQAGSVANLLVTRKPLDAAMLDAIDAVARERGFVRHWPPVAGRENSSVIVKLLEGGPGILQRFGIDLSPSTDDRPFFFQMVPVFGHVDAEVLARHSVNEQSVLLLRRLLVILSLLALGLFLAPFAAAGRLPRGEGIWIGSFYFASLGMAFMLLETSWLQRFVLFLGAPSYAASVVLASLLVGAGAGSVCAGYLGPARVRQVSLAAVAVLAAVQLLMPQVLRAGLVYTLPVRLAVAAALLLPAGWLLGLWFPTGLRAFGEEHKAWFWAVNGVFGVLAGAFSLALAIEWGISAAGMTGVAGYLVAACCLMTLRPVPEGSP